MTKGELHKHLAKPFDKGQVESITKVISGKKKTFDNVAPHHYVQKLVDGLPLGYSTKESSPVFGPSGKSVSVTKTLILHGLGPEGSDLTHEANGSAEIEDESAIAEAFAVKSAASDALKRAMMEMGVGLSLYGKKAQVATEEEPEDEEEEEVEEAPAPRRAAAKPAYKGKPSGSKEWTGDLEVKGTKWTGQKFSAVDGSYIEWFLGNDESDPNSTLYKMFAQEKARREADDTWDPEQGNKKRGGAKKPAYKKKLSTNDSDW